MGYGLLNSNLDDCLFCVRAWHRLEHLDSLKIFIALELERASVPLKRAFASERVDRLPSIKVQQILSFLGCCLAIDDF